MFGTKKPGQQDDEPTGLLDKIRFGRSESLPALAYSPTRLSGGRIASC